MMQKNKYDLVEDFANFMKDTCNSCPLKNECHECLSKPRFENSKSEMLCKNIEKTKELLIKKYNL